MGENRNKLLEASLRYLEGRESELVEQIETAYQSRVFENRYTLHPRRLGQIAREEVKNFKTFVKSPTDSTHIVDSGKQKVLEGLSHKSLMELGEILRRFFLDMKQEEGVESGEVISLVDEFMNLYLSAYIEQREIKILTDQEQLRIALSTALARQRHELFVRNHAIHTSINGILIGNMKGQITYANPAFLRMWGYQHEGEVLSSPMSELWGSEKAEEIESSLTEKGWWMGEVTCERQDGSVFDVAISASIILDDSEVPVGMMTSLSDVTQQHRLEAQFRQSQKMEALGQLAGGIVHDFNNLLTAISGYAQLQLMELPEGTSQYSDFLQIKTASDRGMDLTQELRMFTRQTSDHLEALNVNEIVDESYRILKRTIPPEIEVHLELAPNIRSIQANASQIIQTIMNLCVNARDALESKSKSEEDGGDADTGPLEGRITIRTSNVELDVIEASRFLDAKPGSYTCLTVQDTGCGMSSKIMDRLFEPFFTTKGEKRGTGLGLAVVYGIVQNHSGFIDIQSRPGEGSTFKLYFPVSSAESVESRATTYSPNLTAGKGTILLADDDIQVKEMVLRALEKSGYSVLTAENGLEAMMKYKSHDTAIDLVVLDMVMPQMNGRECMLRLKEIDPDVKVLIMTGYTTDGSADDLLEEGALGLIRKPFELQAFTEAVRKAMNSPAD